MALYFKWKFSSFSGYFSIFTS